MERKRYVGLSFLFLFCFPCFFVCMCIFFDLMLLIRRNALWYNSCHLWFNPHLGVFFHCLREAGRARKRETLMGCPLVFVPSRDWTCNLLVYRTIHQPTKPHWLGLYIYDIPCVSLLYLFMSNTFGMSDLKLSLRHAAVIRGFDFWCNVLISRWWMDTKVVGHIEDFTLVVTYHVMLNFTRNSRIMSVTLLLNFQWL